MGGIWLVIELVEILCPPTYSPSLIKTGQTLLTRRAETLILDNIRAIIKEYLGDLAGYRAWSRHYAHQHIHQV